MTSVTIVIPALNEEHGLPAVLTAIRALPIQTSVIVVDDGSTDRTGDVAREHGATVLRHPMPMGYGRSLKDGIRAATSDIVVITDADGTYPIDRIPALVEKCTEGFALVVGARQGTAYRGSTFKMPARIALKALVEFTTGRHIPDINSGLRAFDRATAMRYIDDLCEGFSFTTTQTLAYMLTWQPVAYLPIDYAKRIGSSKVRMVRDTLRTLQYITESIAHFNPLKLFILLSLTAFVIGLATLPFGGLIGPLFGTWTALVIFALGIVAESLRGVHRTRPTKECSRE